MKNMSVNRLSFIIGTVMALISVFLMLIPFGEPVRVSPLFLVIVPVILLTSLALLSKYLLNWFIRVQINPIFKTVNRISTKDKKRRRLISRNLIGEVKDEVSDWEEFNRQEVEKLKGVENYRKEFLGNVYHELRTPIFNLQGYILTLLDGGLEDESINRVYLSRAEKNINRMISVVEDLESISGLESGKLNLKLEKFNIRKLIDDVLEANELRANKNKIKVEVVRIKESETMVIGDRMRIYQVLNNLVINSLNYGYSGGKTTISVIPAGEKVVIEVKDNGIGIDSTEIPRVFERFYRVDKSRSRDSGGTGLGLAIVKHIIEAHKQTVTIKSTKGIGTTFTFTLTRANNQW